MRNAEQQYLRDPSCGTNRITLGADPEFFVGMPGPGASKTLRPIPVCGLLGGTKKEPRVIGAELDYKGYAAQEDNVMAEYNIPAQTGASSFASSVAVGHQLVMREIHRHKAGVQRMRQSGVMFKYSILDVTPQASQFGCEPDYDAYLRGDYAEAVAPHVLRVKGGEMRYAGGHIHIGWGIVPDMPPHVMANFFDAYAYLPILHMDPQEGRRKLYGSAGRYRPKSYGIEYRTPSNFWIHDTDTASFVGKHFLNVAYSLAYLHPAYLQQVYKTIPWADVKEAINNEDMDKASALNAFLDNDCPIGVQRM